MIMDQEASQLSGEVFQTWREMNPKSDMKEYRYTLSGRVDDKLCSLASELARTKRELDIQKVHADVWKQQYLEQVKENIKLQAFILKEKSDG
jgi:hypothetical protein